MITHIYHRFGDAIKIKYNLCNNNDLIIDKQTGKHLRQSEKGKYIDGLSVVGGRGGAQMVAYW